MDILINILNGNSTLTTIFIICAVIISGFGVYSIWQIINSIFEKSSRKAKEDKSKQNRHIMAVVISVSKLLSVIILFMLVWFLSMTIFGKFSKSTLGNTINPSLDVATSVSVLFAMLTFIITQCIQMKKDRKQNQEDKEKEATASSKKAAEEGLIRIKTAIDNIEDKVLRDYEQVSRLAPEFEKIRKPNDNAEREFPLAFNAMIRSYPNALKLLPNKIKREYQIAINFMPQEVRDIISEKLIIELEKLSIQTFLYFQIKNPILPLIPRNQEDSEITASKILDLTISFMVTRENKAYKSTCIKPPFVFIDEFFFTMQNYIMEVVGRIGHEEKPEVEQSNSQKKDTTTLKKFLEIQDKLAVQGKTDYDVELFIAVLQNDLDKLEKIVDKIQDPTITAEQIFERYDEQQKVPSPKTNDQSGMESNSNGESPTSTDLATMLGTFMKIHDKLEAQGKTDYDVEMFIAVFNNNVDKLKDALEHGGNPNITDKQIFERYNVQQKMACQKTDATPDIKSTSDGGSSTTTSPSPTLKDVMNIHDKLKAQGKTDYDVEMFIAVFNNNVDKLKEALEHGGNPNITDRQIFERYKNL